MNNTHNTKLNQWATSLFDRLNALEAERRERQLAALKHSIQPIRNYSSPKILATVKGVKQ